MAVQALLNGDCDQALVVAAGIPFPQGGYLHLPGGIKSASGACRPFDLGADGVVGGSGAACVVLRRACDTVNKGPEPYGVILGTAINNDGAAKAGYFAPSVSGQARVIEAAVAAAGIDAASIGYLEAHGTGTRIGDPIEWAAASETYTALGARPDQIAVGALKANIGHLDAAAGLASLIKVLRVVKEGVIPPIAGFEALNPLLDAERSPLYVPRRMLCWPGAEPRRAGVSAFGIGGTNAHVIVEQPLTDAAPSNSEGGLRMVTLSAADPEALMRAAKELSQHMLELPADLTDVAYTLAAGRTVMPERLVACGRTTNEIAVALATTHSVVRGRADARPKGLVFLFPGQGAQYPGMALPFAAMPGFTEALEECLTAFEPSIANPARCALLDRTFPAAELNETVLAQPALFALEYAAARALLELGAVPSAVLGHSLGEIAAACVAGALTMPDAARFVAARGAAMQTCPEGAMLALGCDAATAEALLLRSGLRLDLAAINTAETCVVAGTVQAVTAFQDLLGEQYFSRRLPSSRAFHSSLIEPALSGIGAASEGVTLHPLRIPLASNLTGCLVPIGARLESAALQEQARRPVRFAPALMTLADRFSGAMMVEIGPGRTLTSMALAMHLNAVPLCPDGSEVAVLSSVGTLWTLGHPIDAVSLNRGGKLIHLPTYPFFGPRWMAPEAAAGLGGRDKYQPGPAEAAVLAVHQTSAGSGVHIGASPETVGPTLATIWAELLRQSELDDQSDFFELGGDSLLMTSLLRKVNKAFGVLAPPRAMLAARTLGRQTSIIRELLAPN